jgi:DNA-binding IclR family transcriptional regulator
MSDWNAGRTLQSSSLTLDIVDALVELEGARVTNIAEQLDISKSAASNHLHTLQEKGYVITNGDEYYPSLKFTYVGEHARRRNKGYELAADVTRDLNDKTPFETTFIVEENGVGRYLVSETNRSGKHDRYAFVGQKEYLHAIAAGKAILASFSRERVTRIVDHWGLPQITDRTITDEHALFEELERVREQGYATNQQENREVYAIAKAVYQPHGEVLGAMSILTPSVRLRGEDFDRDVYHLLFEHVDQLERRLEAATGTGP